jgi:hypothetical protein
MNKPVGLYGTEDKPERMPATKGQALKHGKKKKAIKEGKSHPKKKGGPDKAGDKPQKSGKPAESKGKKAKKKVQTCPECGSEMESGRCEECAFSDGIAKDIFTGFRGERRKY